MSNKTIVMISIALSLILVVFIKVIKTICLYYVVGRKEKEIIEIIRLREDGKLKINSIEKSKLIRSWFGFKIDGIYYGVMNSLMWEENQRTYLYGKNNKCLFCIVQD